MVIQGVTDPEKSIREAMHRRKKIYWEAPTNIVLASKCLFHTDCQGIKNAVEVWWILLSILEYKKLFKWLRFFCNWKKVQCRSFSRSIRREQTNSGKLCSAFRGTKICVAGYKQKDKIIQKNYFFSMPSNQSPHMAQYLGMYILNIRLSMMSFVKTYINYLK